MHIVGTLAEHQLMQTACAVPFITICSLEDPWTCIHQVYRVVLLLCVSNSNIGAVKPADHGRHVMKEAPVVQG